MNKPKVNITAFKYSKFYDDWSLMYINVIQSLHELGYDVRVSNNIQMAKKYWKAIYPFCKIGIEDNKDSIYIYNHAFPEEVNDLGFFKGKKSIFLKPTGPTNRHYSIDPLGFSSRITITYDKPDFDNINYEQYWNTEVSKIKDEKLNKWTDEYQFKEQKISLPDNHILFIGQMPGDVSVNEFSFSNHLDDIDKLVSKIDNKDPVVIKLHPFMKKRADEEYWSIVKEKINRWENMGHTVIDDFVDIQTILPKTKVAIIENSTSGIECMMYDVPMITFGCPEYRWVSKELRHLINLNKYKNDLSWFNKELSRKFLVWYIRDYLCYDLASTKKRLNEILQ